MFIFKFKVYRLDLFCFRLVLFELFTELKGIALKMLNIIVMNNIFGYNISFNSVKVYIFFPPEGVFTTYNSGGFNFICNILLFKCDMTGLYFFYGNGWGFINFVSLFVWVSCEQ